MKFTLERHHLNLHRIAGRDFGDYAFGHILLDCTGEYPLLVATDRRALGVVRPADVVGSDVQRALIPSWLFELAAKQFDEDAPTAFGEYGEPISQGIDVTVEGDGVDVFVSCGGLGLALRAKLRDEEGCFPDDWRRAFGEVGERIGCSVCFDPELFGAVGSLFHEAPTVRGMDVKAGNHTGGLAFLLVSPETDVLASVMPIDVPGRVDSSVVDVIGLAGAKPAASEGGQP